MAKQPPGLPIVVIGAGIVGTAIAFELQRRGKQILLIDRSVPGEGASFGNMASIAVTEFMPASRPGVWAQMPKWLLDPEGPVLFRPSYLPKLTPWFLRFLAASRPSKMRELEAAGAALCARVYDDLLPMLDAIGAPDMLSREGCLSLYADEAEFRADREHIEVLERFDIAHEVMDGKCLRDLEPALATKIGKAVLFPNNRSVKDPYRLVLLLVEAFERLGGKLERSEVAGFERNADGLAAVQLKDGRRLAAREAVLAAGAWTGRLSAELGEPMPLETERGYHTQIMAPDVSLKHSLIWPARAFMVTPTAGGLRVGGTVEMAGLDAPPDFRRAKVLVKRAKEALPDLQARDTSEWMGHRPALPDTIPIISPSARTKGIFYATGHGHLGLTYAATTARIIGDLVTGRAPPLDIMPYRIDRF